MDRKQIRQYIKQLESDSAKERYIAALALGKSKDISVIPALNKVATLDSNAKVRQIAYQAVKFLSKIKEEEDFRARQAQRDALDDDEGHSVGGWGGIEEILINDDSEDEPWSYQKAVTGGQEKSKKKKNKKSRKERRAERVDKKRRRFRFHIWIAVFVGLIGALLATYDYTIRRDLPQNRTEALEGLETWYTDVVEKINIYSLALAQTEFDCAAFPKYDGGDFYMPTRPVWAKPDGKYLEGLDVFFEHMDATATTMDEVYRRIEGLCGSSDQPRTWPSDSANPQRLIETLRRDHIGAARIELTKAKQANATPTPKADS